MNFQIKDAEVGRLDPLDLKFFYYDIGLYNFEEMPLLNDWAKIHSSFQDKIKAIPLYSNEEIEKDFIDNQIKFRVAHDYDKGNEVIAFFRHLRNAFSHYSIVKVGEWLLITDKNSAGVLTMRGKIDIKLLKDFCFAFFDQTVNFQI